MITSANIALLIPLLWLAGCTAGKRDRPPFKLLSPDQTGQMPLAAIVRVFA